MTLWTAAHQASLSFTISRSLLKLMFIESVMPPNHLILCHPLLLPSIPPSIRIFSNESALCIRWPKYWSFGFCISPSNEYSGLISFCKEWYLVKNGAHCAHCYRGVIASRSSTELGKIHTHTHTHTHWYFYICPCVYKMCVCVCVCIYIYIYT